MVVDTPLDIKLTGSYFIFIFHKAENAKYLLIPAFLKI